MTDVPPVVTQPPSAWQQGGYPPPGGAPYPPPGGAPYPPPGGAPYPPPGGGYYPQGGAPHPGGYPPPAPGAPVPMTVLPAPAPIPGCPPGLEYLSMLDQLLVKQQIELAEILFGCEMNNKYKVKNSMGQDVYFASEKTDCCTRQCCGPLRPFEMKVFDNFEQEVLHFSRPLKCQGCCCPCCLQEMEVSSPRAGSVLGYVKEQWSFCVPKFVVQNAAQDTIFRIEGPVCTCKCCSDVDFKIFAKDGATQIGSIKKQWTGMLREAFTDADNFNVTFPMDLDVGMKAVLFGALFLIDFMYFEQQQNQNQ